MKEKLLILWGGVNEKTSNGGTQWFQQDRIYDTEGIALCLSANEQFNPWYLIREKDDNTGTN